MEGKEDREGVRRKWKEEMREGKVGRLGSAEVDRRELGGKGRQRE